MDRRTHVCLVRGLSALVGSARTIHLDVLFLPIFRRRAHRVAEVLKRLLGQEPVFPLTIVEARAIGVMRMRDEKGIDDKILAVSVRDPAFVDYTDKSQLPAHLLREVKRFFQDYKVLENKQVIVEDLLGPAEAVAIINEALEMYRRLRRGEI